MCLYMANKCVVCDFLKSGRSIVTRHSESNGITLPQRPGAKGSFRSEKLRLIGRYKVMGKEHCK